MTQPYPDIIAQAAALAGQSKADFIMESAHHAALLVIESKSKAKPLSKKFDPLLKEAEACA